MGCEADGRKKDVNQELHCVQNSSPIKSTLKKISGETMILRFFLGGGVSGGRDDVGGELRLFRLQLGKQTLF